MRKVVVEGGKRKWCGGREKGVMYDGGGKEWKRMG